MSKYIPVPQEFDDWASSYDQHLLQGAGTYPFDGYPQVLQTVLHRAQPVPEATVLDLGIGTGNLAALFLAADCRVYGLDFSPKMLEVAQARYPQLCLVQADLLGDWPGVMRQAFDRTCFDLIVSGYAFHHFDLETKLGLLSRLASHHLTPGGRMVFGDIAFPNAAAQDAARLRWAEVWEEEDYWIADETLAACQAAGLSASYDNISSCAGVFTIQPACNQANKEPS